MVKLKGPSKDRLKAYIKENEVRLDSLTRQLKDARKQIERLREELAGAEQKRAENEHIIRKLKEENLFLSKQLELREGGMVPEADKEKLVELYKQRKASEAQALRSAERVLADIEEARSIILRPSERENQGETPQEQQKVEGEATREQVRKPRQERERRDNEAVSQEQRERPENGFIDEKNPQQREAGKLTPRELKRFQESGGGGQRR